MQYLHLPKIWFRDTLDMIKGHQNLSTKEIETIVVEAIIKYLDKSITRPMLSEIVQEIQNAKKQTSSQHLLPVLSELQVLAQAEAVQEEHTEKMYTVLENVLDLMTTGR